ncbi:hypothetical protein [Yinghuangia sp. YIM S09857]|uniref:hypothetical protein n=1 Tax=Yinghuangia sp. YIM S09857 TaxID=3436929 RepID=UPI003F52E563
MVNSAASGGIPQSQPAVPPGPGSTPRVRPAVLYYGPLATFVLGVIAQQLLQEWLDHSDTVLLALLVITLVSGCTAVLIGLQSRSHARELAALQDALTTQTQQNAATLGQLAISSGLAVDYVDDAGIGASYRRAAELIRNANDSITFVDLFEVVENYQAGDPASGDETRPAREDYYRAIREATVAHTDNRSPFHRRVIQVPEPLGREPIPFSADPQFHDYLAFATAHQALHPVSCRIRMAPALIQMHFIIIDRRYLIIPILSYQRERRRLRRHGALFFDDRTGALYSCMRNLYQVIESRSRPLTDDDLDSPVIQPTPT